MNRHVLFYAIVLALAALCAAANWAMLTETTVVSLLYGQFVTSVGMLLAAFVAAIMLIDLAAAPSNLPAVAATRSMELESH